MSSYAIKLDDKLHIIEISKKASPGLAHQQAVRYTDQGFRARVYDTNDDEEIDILYSQLLEKRQNGFVAEYGHVPNGSREDGDGCRVMGNMLLPAFGGKLEGIYTQLSDNGDKQLGTITASQQSSSSEQGITPLTFSSKQTEIPIKKIGGFRIVN